MARNKSTLGWKAAASVAPLVCDWKCKFTWLYRISVYTLCIYILCYTI